jgi:hypothetical protein
LTASLLQRDGLETLAQFLHGALINSQSSLKGTIKIRYEVQQEREGEH